MRLRLAVGCALVLAASAAGFAQDLFEPNPSLAELSADDAYARESARSLKTAGIRAPVAFCLDDAGRVLVAGTQGSPWEVPPDFPRVARLDADGRLDPTFGSTGVVEIPVWVIGSFDLDLDAAGRIVLTGAFYETGTRPWEPGDDGPEYAVARLLADGSLDPAFSGDGFLEVDSAADFALLGPAHAAGSDGALLVLAGGPSPAPEQRRFGLARIAADGTVDSTYGEDGFAPIAPEPWQAEYGYRFDSVTGFAVDSAGRAVVAAWERFGPGFTVRLDAAGGLDASFQGAWLGSDSYWAASRIAFDGAGRLVVLTGLGLSRRLPDGASDPTFSGDGYAWRVEAAAFPGSVDAYADLLDRIRSDPNYDPRTDYPTGFLAVATRADRWVLAKPVSHYDEKGRGVGGIRVQAIDPADPGAIVATIARTPGERFTGLVGLAVTPDGATAYALGNQSVLRIDLGARKPRPLPDLRVKWLGWPHVIHFGGDRYRVTAKVRIRNVSRHDAAAAYGFVGLGDGVEEFPLYGPVSNGSSYAWPFRVRARSSVVKRISWEGKSGPLGLAGARLSVRVACELPDADPADNTATSRQMTPLFAPEYAR